MRDCKLGNAVIFSLLFVLCIASIQVAHAEPKFVLEFGTNGTGDRQLNNPTDVILDKDGKMIYITDANNDRVSIFKYDGNFESKFGIFCDITLLHNCSNNATGALVNGDGQFNNPISITMDVLNNIFVLDADNQRVQVFDDQGKFKSKFGSSASTSDTYLNSSRGVAVQDSDKIMISNTETDAISVFNSSGMFSYKFNSFDGTDSFNDPTNLLIDNKKDILYVADTGNNRIVVFELVSGGGCPYGAEIIVTGKVCYVKVFGTHGTDDGQFIKPTGLALNSAKNLLYVSDTGNNRIQTFKIVSGDTCPTGTTNLVNGVCYVEKFGSKGKGNGQFDAPMGIAVDAVKNRLIVADSKNDRIQIFDTESKPTTLTPSKPSSLKATPASPTSIILSWMTPNLGKDIPAITGYKVEYKVGSKDYVVVAENTANNTLSFVHQGLDSGERYTYRVHSINSEGTSIAASTSAKPEHTTVPVALTATAIGPTQAKLSWFPPSDTSGLAITSYNVNRVIKSGVYDIIGDTNEQTTTFIVNDLTTDKTYSYAISAKIGYGYTEESEPASVTPQEDSKEVIEKVITSTIVKTTKSSAPTRLTAAVVSASQIDIEWRAPLENGNTEITGYKIDVKIEDGAYETLVENTNSTSTKYTHKNLTEHLKYTYKISAINVEGTSEPSNELFAMPKATILEINSLNKFTTDEGKILRFIATISDKSVTNPTFSLTKNKPAGSQINENTGAFTWTPSDSQGGKIYTLSIIASKGSLTDTESVTIVVNDILPVIVEEKEKELGIAGFVDETKTQSYIERYNTEPAYKEWFDKNYPQYESIYEAVGVEEPKGLAAFVNETVDPQKYVYRYNTEPTYKEWFDKNYPQYESIYEAVGVEKPKGLAAFVNETVDPQKYVYRYNTEPTYKEWFDKNYPQYESIYEAVGVEKPKEGEVPVGYCAEGTELVDGVCTVIQEASTPPKKPWWQFW